MGIDYRAEGETERARRERGSGLLLSKRRSAKAWCLGDVRAKNCGSRPCRRLGEECSRQGAASAKSQAQSREAGAAGVHVTGESGRKRGLRGDPDPEQGRPCWLL